MLSEWQQPQGRSQNGCILLQGPAFTGGPIFLFGFPERLILRFAADLIAVPRHWLDTCGSV